MLERPQEPHISDNSDSNLKLGDVANSAEQSPRLSRALETADQFEARLEQYKADGMARKLMKSFAHDKVACMKLEGLFTKEEEQKYSKIFDRFGL